MRLLCCFGCSSKGTVERMSVCTTDGAEPPTRMDGNEVQRGGNQEGGVWEMKRRVQEVGLVGTTRERGLARVDEAKCPE